MPPTYSGSDSKIVTATPCLLSMYPAVRPAGPAPMIPTFMASAIPAHRHTSDVADSDPDAGALVNIDTPITPRGETPEVLPEDRHIDTFFGPAQVTEVLASRWSSAQLRPEQLTHHDFHDRSSKSLYALIPIDFERPYDGAPSCGFYDGLTP